MLFDSGGGKSVPAGLVPAGLIPGMPLLPSHCAAPGENERMRLFKKRFTLSDLQNSS